VIYTVDEIAMIVFAVADRSAIEEKQLRLVESSLERSEQMIHSFLQRNTAYAARTVITSAGMPEYQADLIPSESVQRHRDVIFLPTRPVEVGTIQVWENRETQDFTGISPLVAGKDYQLEGIENGWSRYGLLRRLNRSWPTSPGGVKVTYYSGMDSARNPDFYDMLRLATLITFRSEYAKAAAYEKFTLRPQGPVASESIGKYSYSNDNANLNAAVSGEYSSIPLAAIDYLQPLVSYGVFL
jgi:hypothetical protein